MVLCLPLRAIPRRMDSADHSSAVVLVLFTLRSHARRASPFLRGTLRQRDGAIERIMTTPSWVGVRRNINSWFLSQLVWPDLLAPFLLGTLVKPLRGTGGGRCRRAGLWVLLDGSVNLQDHADRESTPPTGPYGAGAPGSNLAARQRRRR